MDGLWSGGPAQENLRQAEFIRDRPLVVNCGTRTNVAWNAQDASGLASLDPNGIASGTKNTASDRGYEGGPHFILSGRTTDNSHSYGFQFCLFNRVITNPALPASGGYNVTVWVLMPNSMNPVPGITYTPIWAAFATRTGVGVQQLYSSFDVNACAVRFQFGNLNDDPTLNSLSLGIFLAEL